MSARWLPKLYRTGPRMEGLEMLPMKRCHGVVHLESGRIELPKRRYLVTVTSKPKRRAILVEAMDPTDALNIVRHENKLRPSDTLEHYDISSLSGHYDISGGRS